jgi:hypothetical protein
VEIMSNLTRAAEILASYSDGRLPEPASVSVGRTFISFNMREAEDVGRWAQSVDVAVDTYTTKPNEITGQIHYQAHCSFKHDNMIVYVSHSHEVKD